MPAVAHCAVGPDACLPPTSTVVQPVTPEAPHRVARPVLRQRWSELAYLHWPYEPEVVQRHLPAGLTVDTCDGHAWVGLIPFEMRNVQLGRTRPLPWVSSFVEINVRTYVTDSVGRRAVWFFSLDVPRSAIVAVARSVFSLPYCWAHALHASDSDRHRYQMTRRWPRGEATSAELSFTVGDEVPEAEVSHLDHFLTARWALITQRRGRLLYGQVGHPRWPLHRVEDVEIDQNVVEAAGLPSPVGPPLVLYSPGVDVEVAWFEKLPYEETP